MSSVTSSRLATIRPGLLVIQVEDERCRRVTDACEVEIRPHGSIALKRSCRSGRLTVAERSAGVADVVVRHASSGTEGRAKASITIGRTTEVRLRMPWTGSRDG